MLLEAVAAPRTPAPAGLDSLNPLGMLGEHIRGSLMRRTPAARTTGSR
jgi:hypothetical protein